VFFFLIAIHEKEFLSDSEIFIRRTQHFFLHDVLKLTAGLHFILCLNSLFLLARVFFIITSKPLFFYQWSWKGLTRCLVFLPTGRLISPFFQSKYSGRLLEKYYGLTVVHLSFFPYQTAISLFSVIIAWGRFCVQFQKQKKISTNLIHFSPLTERLQQLIVFSTPLSVCSVVLSINAVSILE
jgi:hypothetical protein